MSISAVLINAPARQKCQLVHLLALWPKKGIRRSRISHSAKGDSMAKVYVSATIMAKEGCELALKSELNKVMKTVRAEKGCVRYDLHQSEYGNAFFFYEVWESPAHLAAHARSGHMAAMHAATEELTVGSSEVNMWEAVNVAE